MKCFNCGKNFDYEKYYGICPKCGCYNKEESSQELHQELHDTYDQGYSHEEPDQDGQSFVGEEYGSQEGQSFAGGEYTGNIVVQEVEPRKKTGGTKFLVLSIVIFLLVFIGGTAAGMIYESAVEKRLQREVLEAEVEILEHEPGEAFAFRELTLQATEACTLAYVDELDLPRGKKLVAVHMEGTGDGEWKEENQLPEAYMVCNNSWYCQVPYYDYDAYGNVYQKPAFDPYGLTNETYAEGWIAFLLDEDADSFTLCLEEYTGENQVKIEKIHKIPLTLSEDENNGQSH